MQNDFQLGKFIFQDVIVNIICRDCNLSSQSIYHVIGLKCNHCCGYNTVRADDKLFVRVNSERKYFHEELSFVDFNSLDPFQFWK